MPAPAKKAPVKAALGRDRTAPKRGRATPAPAPASAKADLSAVRKLCAKLDRAAGVESHFGPGQPARYCGKPGRSGPPKGNNNALRHGLKAGKLPKDAKHIEYQVNALRRNLEDAVMAARGDVTIPDAAAIQTAMKWERHGALCLRWLRIEGDKLKPEQKMNFSREIAKASAERDKAIAALKLNVSPLDPWKALNVTSINENGDGNGEG